jgi:hypothetical protein
LEDLYPHRFPRATTIFPLMVDSAVETRDKFSPSAISLMQAFKDPGKTKIAPPALMVLRAGLMEEATVEYYSISGNITKKKKEKEEKKKIYYITEGQ